MKWLLKHLLAALILVVVMIAGAMVFLDVATKHNQELTVPDLSNMSVEEADSVAALNDTCLNNKKWNDKFLCHSK